MPFPVDNVPLDIHPRHQSPGDTLNITQFKRDGCQPDSLGQACFAVTGGIEIECLDQIFGDQLCEDLGLGEGVSSVGNSYDWSLCRSGIPPSVDIASPMATRVGCVTRSLLR